VRKYKYYSCSNVTKSGYGLDHFPYSTATEPNYEGNFIDAVYLRHMEYAGDISDVTALQIKQDPSKHILFIHIGALEIVAKVASLKSDILECYDKGISVVIDATWEAIQYSDHLLEVLFTRIKPILHDEYFKILISQDFHYTPFNFSKLPHIEKYFIYYNMFADMIYTYHAPIYKNTRWPNSSNTVKRYKFSCLSGCFLRHHRLNFLINLFNRNLLNDEFYLSGIPVMFSVERNQPMHNAPALHHPGNPILRDNDSGEFEEFYLPSGRSGEMFNNALVEGSGDFLEDVINWFKTSKAFQNDMNFKMWEPELFKCFIENAAEFLNQIKFFGGNDIPKLINIKDRPRIYYSHIKKDFHSQQFIRRQQYHWDKILPNQLFESHINVPLETYFNHACFYTEKTMKPIFAGIPFISLSVLNFQESFKRMGFEPYYNIFDYSYDTFHDPNELNGWPTKVLAEKEQPLKDPFKRINFIADQLEGLSKESNLKSLVEKDKEAILHNQQQIIKISNDTSYLDKL